MYCSIFTGFTIPISYLQVFYIFFILSFLYSFWFCLTFVFSRFTFLLYYEVFIFFFKSQFCTYIFAYFWFFYLFHLFRFYYTFNILTFSIFSLLLCFSYVLYLEFPLPLAIGFLSRKCLSTSSNKGVDKCVYHTSDVERLMNFIHDLISLKLQYILHIQMIIIS